MAEQTKTPLTLEGAIGSKLWERFFQNGGTNVTLENYRIAWEVKHYAKNAPEGARPEDVYLDPSGQVHFTKTPVTLDRVYEKFIAAGYKEEAAKAWAAAIMTTENLDTLGLEQFIIPPRYL